MASGLLDASELDFGEVPVGEWRTARVKVRNVGYVPFRAYELLRLEDNPSYQLEFDEGRLMPGEEREVVIRFHPLEEGALTERFHVATDADDKPQEQVLLRGVGTPTPARIEPSHLDFETLELDSDRILEVTVTNPVDLPLMLRVQGDSADPFTTDVVTIPPMSTQVVRTRYFPQLEGDNAGVLELRACESCTAVSATVQGRGVPYAFEFDPAPVPFQHVPVHETTRNRTRMKNVTWRPVGVSRTETSDVAFKALTDLAGRQFQPGEEAEVELEFAARYAGPAVGELLVAYRSDRDRKAPLLLDARGGRPTLAVAPVTIDFGEVPVGSKAERVVRLTNAGSDGPLYFQGVSGGGESASQFSVSEAYRGEVKSPSATYAWTPDSAWPSMQAQDPVAILPGSDALDVRAFFNPDRVGDFQATLVFKSDDMFFPERTITVTGRARESGPCVFQVKPGSLDFGNVITGRGAVLGFYFENTGTKECAVKDIHLSNDAGGKFFMPGGPIAGGSVPWASSFSSQIAFRSQTAGEFQGELSITVNSAVQPVYRMPIRAVSQPTCLIATPAYLDFGAIRTDCAPTPRTTLVANVCSQPITVESAVIGEGTSGQYTMAQPPALPRTLQPAEGFELKVNYSRTVLGQHYSPLYVRAAGEAHPFLIPLVAETNMPGYQVDRFMQGTDNQLDVLFVVSNTTTMGGYQDRLQAAIPGWLQRAASRGVDLRVGVTTTGLVSRSSICGGGASGGEAGRLFPVDGTRPRVLSDSTVNAATLLQQNLEVGICHNLEQGLEAMRSALSSPLIDRQDDPRTAQPNDGNLGLLRGSARLSVIFVSDEDDHSGFEPESYVQFLQSLKGTNMGHRVSANAIVPVDPACQTAGAPGSRFSSVARRTGGQVMSVCASDYLGFLDQITARAAGPQREFRLSYPVSDPSAIVVRVAGQIAAAGSWSYDGSKQAIVFEAASTPSAGQQIQVDYQAVCVNP